MARESLIGMRGSLLGGAEPENESSRPRAAAVKVGRETSPYIPRQPQPLPEEQQKAAEAEFQPIKVELVEFVPTPSVDGGDGGEGDGGGAGTGEGDGGGNGGGDAGTGGDSGNAGDF